MKKTLVGTLALGLILGAGTLTIKSFADENQAIPIADNTQSYSQFQVLNQETNQFKNLDDSQYRDYNPNYGQGCCTQMNFGDFRNGNIN